jgi:dienelactone hydrolase
MRHWLAVSLCALSFVTAARADGPRDNVPGEVRRIPKLGIEVPADKRAALEKQLATLEKAIGELEKQKDPALRALVPDIQIYYKAVHDALVYQEFFTEKEINVAFDLLKEGQERADQLAQGAAPWTSATGLVVRGYVSKIDGSVQPYGLVVPKSYTHRTSGRYRLDLWFHGRGETLSELNFIEGRRKQVGQFAPADTLVLHPYGRYSNAFKFAGEVDVLEALEAVKKNYRVDGERIAVRGFSMGGAGCWQFAVHYADRWVAANPGAGFSETPEFLRIFQSEEVKPTWYERKLFHLYDCTDWAANLFHCPTVAYSGELDTQKQAADIMAAALEKDGIELKHIIGPQTKHAYHPESAATVERLMGSIAETGRERLPRYVQLTTYTLKYNRMHWVTIDGLAEHWARAHVEAELGDEEVFATTENVTDLSLDIPAGWCHFDPAYPVELSIDEQGLEGPKPKSDRSWHVDLYRLQGTWRIGKRPAEGPRKRHELQGPIDDAFMDSFIFVRPSGKSKHELVEKWVTSELERAIEHWRRHFRGEARVKLDRDVSDQDIASANLVLWGDPTSNTVLGRIADQLPIRWQADQIAVDRRTYPADENALVMIYPNPLNGERYVVLNSGFTFREFAYLNNARQVPKLPDWAVVNLRTPTNALWPGEIKDADFFGERWEIKPPRE